MVKKKNVNKKVAGKKDFRWLFLHWLIPLIILSIGLIATAAHIAFSGESFSVLNQYHSKKSFSTNASSELLKGKRITGEIKSSENNLGSVTIHFESFNRVNLDTLVFRLKEKGAKNWYYESKYYTIQFYHLPLYPIGFPVIKDSKNKVYVFEIESLSGVPGNAVAISNEKPYIISGYQFTKSEIVDNKLNALQFFYKKTLNLFLYENLLFILLIYISPFLIYVTHVMMPEKRKKQLNALLKKYNIKLPQVLIYFIFFLILLDTFSLKTFNNGIIITLSILLAVILVKTDISTKSSYFMAVIFILLAGLTDNMALNIISKKLLIWAVMLLLVATLKEAVILMGSKQRQSAL